MLNFSFSLLLLRWFSTQNQDRQWQKRILRKKRSITLSFFLIDRLSRARSYLWQKCHLFFHHFSQGLSPNSILPRLSTNRDILDATTHQGVHTRIPTSRHGWPPPWSNCFAGINIHLASATRLLATAERNCRSSTTIIAASHCPESWDRRACCSIHGEERNYVQRSGMKISVVSLSSSLNRRRLRRWINWERPGNVSDWRNVGRRFL